MRKVDALIGVAGAAVLTAVVVGTILYGGLHGETQDWVERTVDLEAQEGQVGPSATAFRFDAPDGATGAQVQVDLVFEGQAVQGGQATVRVELVDPEGALVAERTEAMAVPAGASMASRTFRLGGAWAEPPAPDASQQMWEWDAPLEVRVLAESPGDVPLASSYAFHATVHVAVTVHGPPLHPEGAEAA